MNRLGNVCAFDQTKDTESLQTSEETRIDWLEEAVQQGFWKSFASIIWFRFNQFLGTYQGYRQSGPITQHLRLRYEQ
ncbi:MAG: hypothetical protein QGM50_09750 [Anaerolineae bacterium]|nr:hypothetical protein [Anaerolineae bacterium]